MLWCLMCLSVTLVKYATIVYWLLLLARKVAELIWGKVYLSNEISARGKIVVITGASAGIGQAAAKEFAQRDATVILACRDVGKAEKTVEWIRTKTGLGTLVCMKMDLASLESIREFVKEFKSKYDRIDILVNNAGVQLPPEDKRKTVDGFEIHMGVNHLGHFLLTNLLLDLLKKGAPSRIVTLTSTGHAWNNLNLDDIMSDKKSVEEILSTSKIVANQLYTNSKMANALFNKELAKKLEGTGVSTYAMCPGGVYTDIGANLKGPAYFAVKVITMLMKTAEEGAATIMYCALSKNLTSVSGGMYQDCGYWDASDRVPLMDGDAKKLWDVSAKLVGL